MPPNSPVALQANRDSRQAEILSAQIQLLYANASLALGVTILAATILAGLLRGLVSPFALLGWWLYMAVVSASRCLLAIRYRRASPADSPAGWLRGFAWGAGLAGVGWGSAAILLFPGDSPTYQVALVFIVGGMMLGAASLLAPRPEAFLAFLIPTGLGPAVRLLAQDDRTHFAMGLLAAVFTAAVVITTYRIYRTVHSSLSLKFENRDLVEEVLAAQGQTEALNQNLERRVEERTAELLESAEKLRGEIAQRQRMEEELLRARKLESLGVLAGGIAHDFNNFLAIVLGNTEVAKAQLDEADPVQENLDQTLEACNRAASLSSQLLTFAKGGAPIRRVMSVGKLITDAVRLARAGSSISIAVHIAEDLGFALVDPGQIGQVLHNIILNARQSMLEGGIIEVRAENLGARIRISIQDYGCGIPADVLPRIFDPYFTTKTGGSGLGLATAYAIVTKHGGLIAVESTPGVGTTFTIELPASEHDPAPATPVVTQAPARGSAERILVMEDEDAIRDLLRTVLGKLGYQVQTARDGAEAIALYERERATGKSFDAVLLDLTVRGGMGGIEAAGRLKEIDPSCKLIVSSGYADAPVMADFAEYGFSGVIPKPWTSKVVGDVFRSVLVPEANRKID